MDRTLFDNGQYQSLLENLQRVKQDGSIVGSMLEQLSLSNNQAVCKYLLGRDEEEKKSCSLGFVDVLKKCRSVPAREEILCVELGTLYNYIYYVTESSHNNDRSTEVIDMHSHVCRTLSRVCRMLSQQKKLDDVSEYTDIKTACHVLLHDILEKLQYGIGNESLAVSVCQCLLPLAVHEIRNENTSTAYKLLEKVKIIIKNIETGIKKQLTLSLPLRMEHSHLHLLNKVHIKDTISLLMGICLCRGHSWDEAFSNFEDISTQEMRVVAQFFCGFTSFKSGKYTESISSLLEMLRSGLSITQRLKARIYNLIGKCFDKLSKCQLSVQMFKEALCADFSYLVPLYNTSLQYRTHGDKDVELECLNLLVTALTMRERSESYESNMDVGHLLSTEDEDMPYIKALYSLSVRSLQLKRFHVAAERYGSLLDHLRSWKTSTKEFMTCLPPLLQIHHEAIEALLMSKKYKECVSLCDRVLLCYCNNMSDGDNSSILSQTFNLTPSQGPDYDSQTEKGKRKFYDVSQSEEDEHFGDVDAIALKFKAMALFKMGDNTGSLVCLDRAVDCISSYRKLCLHQKMKAVTRSVEPSKKRQKVDNTSMASVQRSPMESGDELAASSSREVSVPSVCDKASVNTKLSEDPRRMLELEQDLYKMTAEVLAFMDKENDSIHYNRLASQIQVLKEKLLK